MINIRDFDAKGDGIHDDRQAIQKALNKCGDICIPAGNYKIGGTLYIHSDTHIFLEKSARFFIADGALKARHDYLLTNSDKRNGNSNIIISGGIWDGNNVHNRRSDDMFNPTTFSGTMLDFFNVENIRLENMTLSNPECYYTRFCHAKNVSIDNIFFNTKYIRPNQDGIHLAGYCYDFRITNLSGTRGSPNDDFVALNADDCLTRLQNFDVECGPIENIYVENLYSPKCLSFIRMLSVDSPIRNVTVKNVKGSCKVNLLNIDASKYCRTPLVTKKEPRFYSGVGCIENVLVENISVKNTFANKALILIESNVNNFSVINYENCAKFRISPFMLMQNVASASVDVTTDKKPISVNVNHIRLNAKKVVSLHINKKA